MHHTQDYLDREAVLWDSKVQRSVSDSVMLKAATPEFEGCQCDDVKRWNPLTAVIKNWCLYLVNGIQCLFRSLPVRMQQEDLHQWDYELPSIRNYEKQISVRYNLLSLEYSVTATQNLLRQWYSVKPRVCGLGVNQRAHSHPHFTI